MTQPRAKVRELQKHLIALFLEHSNVMLSRVCVRVCVGGERRQVHMWSFFPGSLCLFSSSSSSPLHLSPSLPPPSPHHHEAASPSSSTDVSMVTPPHSLSSASTFVSFPQVGVLLSSISGSVFYRQSFSPSLPLPSVVPCPAHLLPRPITAVKKARPVSSGGRWFEPGTQIGMIMAG